MVTQPSPTPQTSAAPNQSALNQLQGLVNTSSLLNQGGGSGGPTSVYGLTKDALGAQFDLTGLPGLGSGQLKGKDLVDAFLAAGSSGDPAQAQIVAAIQHALLYSGYYSKDYTPNFGVAKKQDAEALAASVNDLTQANLARPQPQSLAQWLAGQSAIGATQGAATAQAVAPTVVNVRAPNAADVAAVYQKVAQQVEGHKPSQAELNAFVSTYTQSYIANERANINAQVQAAQQKAQVKAQAIASQPAVKAPPVTPPPTPQQQFLSQEVNDINNPGVGNLPHGLAGEDSQYVHGSSAPQVHQQIQNQVNQEAQGQPSSLTDSMATLQQIINERANASGAAAAATPQVIEAGTTAPESPEVAAENFARNKNPRAAAATDVNNAFQTFLQLLSGKVTGLS